MSTAAVSRHSLSPHKPKGCCARSLSFYDDFIIIGSPKRDLESDDDKSVQDKPKTKRLDANSEYTAVETPTHRNIRLLKQGMVLFFASLGYWSLGMGFSFPSAISSDLDRYNTTIYGTFIKISETEKDLIGSFIPAGSLSGTFICGWLLTYRGRRAALFLTSMVFTVSWIGLGLAPNTYVILLFRFLTGFGVGCSRMVTSIYATELSDPSVRGNMLAISSVGQRSGQLVIAVLGYYTRYYMAAFICSVFSIIMFIACFFLPESPTVLILQGDIDGAHKVLRSLRGNHVDNNAEIQYCLDKNNIAKGGAWTVLLQGKNRNKLATIVGLFFFHVFSGTLVLVAYASRIFKSSGSSIGEGIATIIVMAVQVVAVVFLGTLLDSIGRKKTLMGSFLGMAMSLGIMASFVSVTMGNEEAEGTYGWLPLVSMMIAVISASLGAAPIPFIISGEYFPTALRSQAMIVCQTIGPVFAFLSLQLYGPMQMALSTAGLYGFYAIISLLGFLYTGLFIEETKGMSVG